MSRSIGACLQLLSALQATGLKWSKTLTSREDLVRDTNYYLKKLNIYPNILPPSILIVGTKGKGSTASFTESILRTSGLRTGLFTSPHLVSLTERIRIGGKSIDETLFLDTFWETEQLLHDDIHELIQPTPIPITTTTTHAINNKTRPGLPGFNLLALVAFRIFSRLDIDLMILEAGVGGKLDIINIIDHPLACAVTTLDFDHMELLGDTLPEIAKQKAGIFRSNVPTITAPQRIDAMEALIATAKEKNTPLWQISTNQLMQRAGGKFPTLGLSAKYQETNAAIAVALADITLNKFGKINTSLPKHSWLSFEEKKASQQEVPLWDIMYPLLDMYRIGLQTTTWPGRAQTVDLTAKGKIIIPDTRNTTETTTTTSKKEEEKIISRMFLDGAHTEASMVVAVQWFLHTLKQYEKNKNKRIILIFTCGVDKDPVALLISLSILPIDSVFITSVQTGMNPRQNAPLVKDALIKYVKNHEKSITRLTTSISSMEEKYTTPSNISWIETLKEILSFIYTDSELQKYRLQIAKDLATTIPKKIPSISTEESVEQVMSKIHNTHPMNSTSQDNEPDTLIITTGSLYLVGAALKYIGWKP